MMECKVFIPDIGGGHRSLEKKINEWFKENPSLKFKTACFANGDGRIHNHTALVFYERDTSPSAEEDPSQPN